MFWIFLILFAISVGPLCSQHFTQYVDPFIGTEGEGHTFPGATLPFGMVKLGPDCKGHSNSGYISGGIIEGFSHTHVSGTGGGAKYGNILVKPWVGPLDLNDVNDFFQVSNEPGFLTPYLYTYAGRQDKSAERIKHILQHNYHSGRGGIPGNDDSGTMGSWFVYNSMGFYPNAGQDVYLIGSPLFKKSLINLPDGKDFSVLARNFDKENI